MEQARAMEIKVTRTYEVPKDETCSGCGYKDGDVYCSVFRKVIHLDSRYRNRVPVPECLKARKAASRARKSKKNAK